MILETSVHPGQPAIPVSKVQEDPWENAAQKVMEVWLELQEFPEIQGSMVYLVNQANKAKMVNRGDLDCVGQPVRQVLLERMANQDRLVILESRVKTDRPDFKEAWDQKVCQASQGMMGSQAQLDLQDSQDQLVHQVPRDHVETKDLQAMLATLVLLVNPELMVSLVLGAVVGK